MTGETALRGPAISGPVDLDESSLKAWAADVGDVIWHADLYRLESPELLVDVGWPELVDSDNVVFVEWAERAENWLPADRWEVRLDFADRPDERRVEIRHSGECEPPPAPMVDPC